MNWWKLLIQFTFLWKSVVTNYTFNGLFPSWTDKICLLKLTFCLKRGIHISHLKDFVMHKLQILHLNGLFPAWTDATCLFRLLFSRKTEFTNCTFESFFTFMNWWKMLIHFTFLRKTVVTNYTFEWLLTFMNW